MATPDFAGTHATTTLVPAAPFDAGVDGPTAVCEKARLWTELREAILDTITSMRELLAEQTGNPNYKEPFYDEIAFVDPGWYGMFTTTTAYLGTTEPSVWDQEVAASLAVHRYEVTVLHPPGHSATIERVNLK